MKILYINTLYAPYIGGGAEITLQTQVEGMQRAGHEVAVLTIGPEPGLHREEVNGVTIWRAGYRNLYFHHRSAQVSPWRRVLWHLRDRYNRGMQDYVRSVVAVFRPDVASCHNLAGWSIAVWDALTELNVPIVQVLHDQYLLCPKSTMFKRGDRCASQCISCKALRTGHVRKSKQVAAVIGVSRFIREKFIANGYFESARIKASVPNARNVNLSALPLGPQGHDDQVIFGYIGTLSPNKGIELLLQAFSDCSEGNWKLRVAGTGLEEYEGSLRSKYLGARIEFLGRVDPAEFFPSVDATIVPSIWEDTLPGVVFESLIFGKPVLGSKRGGIPEMVGPESGILFNPSSDEIAVALASFAKDLPTWRSRFADIQRIGRMYADESAWLARYEELFADARDRSVGVNQ